ncbi:HD family phosphohydrolase [Cyanobacterium aponinum FACHB-4101]|uniref:HD family phosphohydrolase n=1 Tax=Cyanobacterium aponinum TaxID=379064 RepID=UPI001680834D|nr:HD family phosphohydrolase [Cyanobacterium aponinum]MBD2393940.1 HD family phosphohydrolase [Cyanobacterium aponinum FACHB-4101]
MNALQLIGKTIKNWQNKSLHQSTVTSNKESSSNNVSEDSQPFLLRCICRIHSPVMIIISVTSLTGLISYRFYNQPELAVGTISPAKIVAPRDGSFVDQKTTDELRKKIRNGSLPVLQEDTNISNRLRTNLENQLREIDNLRSLKRNISLVSTGIISTPIQLYLFNLSQNEWQEIINDVNSNQPLNLENNAVRQLWNYKQQVDEVKFQNLLNQLQLYREQYQTIESQIQKISFDNLSRADKEVLFSLDRNTWQKSRQQILKTQKLILTQGISAGLPEEIKEQTVQIHLENALPPNLVNIGVKLLLPNLKPNLIIDQEKTSARAEKAAQEIEPVVVSIQKNEVIVNAGEKITQGDFILLDNFGLSRRSINWTGILGSGALVSVSLITFMAIADRVKKKLRRRDQVLIWLFSLSIPAISIVDVGYNSLPAVGFLTSTFYGPTLALTHVTLMTGLTIFQIETVGWQYLIPSFAGGILASVMASRLHSREELALLGAGVGLTQGSVYFIVHLVGSAAAGTVWYALLPGALWHGTVGLTYTVLALGISPYLERFFDLITPIRLAELSNPNRPLLKRLATEAPGTFQHTMFVASLAEAAARRLHCNVELVRAGTLYHDIGKMHDPLGFIENQMGGPNKHDMINNPWKSADIIKKHVSEGIVMAKKCGLPQAITDFIPQHQGTLLISYFYFQAKNQKENNPEIMINESDFRYDGPIPQSRETGIVMLADGCEAALRSLKNATPDQAMAMVNKIFKARWRDHQLDDCGIKYEELPIIAEVFVNVWQQFNHQRIAYPKGALDRN